jgi:hypothetical protein
MTFAYQNLRNRLRVSTIVLVLFLVLAYVSPQLVQAHGDHNGNVQTFTETVGPYDLLFTVELPSAVPGWIHLTITPQNDLGQAMITLRAVPQGRTAADAQAANVEGILNAHNSYDAELLVEQSGDWMLEVHVGAVQGSGTTEIPFSLASSSLPTSTLLLLIALGGLGVLLISSVVWSRSSRRTASQRTVQTTIATE